MGLQRVGLYHQVCLSQLSFFVIRKSPFYRTRSNPLCAVCSGTVKDLITSKCPALAISAQVNGRRRASDECSHRQRERESGLEYVCAKRLVVQTLFLVVKEWPKIKKEAQTP